MHNLQGAAWALLAIALLIAAGTDLKARIIPNWLVAGLALLAPVFWWVSGISLWPDVAWQLGSALLMMAIGTGLFAMGQMGGGDVKLLGALALWFPPLPMLNVLIVMSILGGALTLGMLIWHRIKKNQEKPEIPYGLAIAAAGLWVICQRNLNHFA